MKKKLSILLVCFLLLSQSLLAQDKIYFKNGNITEAKILEVSSSEIAFKKTANLEGPTYHEPKSSVIKIEYSNGTSDIFSETVKEPLTPVKITAPLSPVAAQVTEEKKEVPFTYKKNAVSYTVSDAFFKRITLAYERIIANGYLSLKVPVSFGLGSNKVFDVDYLNSFNSNTNEDYYYSNQIPSDVNKYTSIVRKNTFGLEINAYPFGQRPVSFFVGPAFYYGILEYKLDETKYYTTYNSTYNYTSYTAVTNTKQGTTKSYSGMMNVGFSFISNADFLLNLQIGIGFRQNQTDFDDYTATLINPSFQIGYRF